MDWDLIASSALAFAIGWNAVSFAKALKRGDPLWPSGLLLAVLVPMFIALKVNS